MTNKTREVWSDKTWSEGIFESLERFVSTNSEESIKKFVETGNQEDLYDGMGPEPRPVGDHVEYMRAYAENELVD